jgi:branched-chain amino acid aminotransferase
VVQNEQFARSQAALYGKGIFTTIAVYDGIPFFWHKHWRRLTRDAERIGIDLAQFSADGVKAAIIEAIARQKITDGRVRVTFNDNRPAEIWPGDVAGETTSMSVIAAERRPVARPFRCFVSPQTINSRSPLAGVKSCNYLENILAIEDAKQRSFHEGIRLNEHGHVASACMANVFWLKDGRLYTPSLSTGCLAGTTREFALENVECDEVEAGIDDVDNADAMFLTSAGLGIVAVEEFNDRKMVGEGHAILRLIGDHQRRKHDR